MTHTIGHLHHRLHLRGDAAGPFRARLERLVAHDVLAAYGEALDAALRDDPAVYVVHRAHMRVAISGDIDGDPLLARLWGQGMAKVVVQTLDDPANVRRFENQAAFVAAFIADLLTGQAWEQWCYGAFAQLRGATPDEAIGRVLLENRPHLPEILAFLGRRTETMQAFFRAVSPATLHAVWQEGLRDPAATDREAARPILLAVMQWAGRLNLWPATPPSIDTLLTAYFRERWLILDWRDTASLTLGFADVVLFGRQRGWLRPWSAGAPFDAALDALDWLDQAQLRRLLLTAQQPAGWAPEVIAPIESARRESLLRALADALGRVHLDSGRPDSPANAIHWASALKAEWAGDAYALALVEAFLTVWARMAQQGTQPDLWSDAPGAAPLDHWLAMLGPAGRRVLDALLAQSETLSPSGRPAGLAARVSEEEGFESRCAGLFLLLRALLDARLPQFPARLASDQDASFDVLAAGLAWHWAGPEAADDPGLLLFAGLPQALTMAELRRRAAAVDAQALRAALLRALVGRRLIRGDFLGLHRWPLAAGRTALVAEAGAVSPDTPGVWVFGRIGETGTLPQEWIDTWEHVSGRRPAVVEATDSTRLASALRALHVEPAAATEFDLTMALTAAALLRLWAQWLGRFAASGVPYLLEQFVRRGGAIIDGDHEIRVMLDSRSLDIILGAAGYLSDIERVDRLGSRRVRFGIRGN